MTTSPSSGPAVRTSKTKSPTLIWVVAISLPDTGELAASWFTGSKSEDDSRAPSGAPHETLNTPTVKNMASRGLFIPASYQASEVRRRHNDLVQ